MLAALFLPAKLIALYCHSMIVITTDKDKTETGLDTYMFSAVLTSSEGCSTMSMAISMLLPGTHTSSATEP